MSYQIDPAIFTNKNKIFLVGAMGSGKTEIGINYSLQWSRYLNEKVSLLDFDMTKPNFRLRSISDTLHYRNLEIIVPPGPYGWADFPIISARMESAIRNPDERTIADIGGDGGARIIGRYRGALQPENSDFWFVFNGMRPFEKNMEEISIISHHIEKAMGYSITGLIHNSHLMLETEPDILVSRIPSARKIAEEMGVPLLFHCIREDMADMVSKEINRPILPVKLHLIPEWMYEKPVKAG